MFLGLTWWQWVAALLVLGAILAVVANVMHGRGHDRLPPPDDKTKVIPPRLTP